MAGTYVADNSTKFHYACMSNPNFNLAEACPTHPLVLAWKESGINQPSKPTAPATGSGATGDKVVIDKSRAAAALAKLERNASSPDMPEIIATLCELLSLN